MALTRLNDTESVSIEEVTPPNDTMTYYFGELIKQRVPSAQSTLKKGTVGTLKASAIVVGSLSGIPYISPAMKFAGEGTIGSYILGYGIFTSLATVSNWALLDVVDSMQLHRDAKYLLPNRSRSCAREVAYWFAMPILGISAAFPVSYLIYTYNPDQLAFTAMSLFTDTITNTCSLNRFYLDLKTYQPYYFGNKHTKKIERARWELIRKLNAAADVLPNVPREQVNALVQRIKGNENEFDIVLLLRELIKLSQPYLESQNNHKLCYQGLTSNSIKLVSSIFPFAWAIFGVINSYESFGELFENEYLRWIISIASTFPYLFLEMQLAIAVFTSLHQIIADRRYGQYQKSVGENYFPILFYCATLLGLFTTFSAFGSRARFVTDEIEGNLGVALAIIVCISTVSYKSAAMLNMIKLFFEMIAIKFGKEEVADLCKLIKKIRHFNGIIADADLQKVVELIEMVQDEELSDLVTDEDLEEPENAVIPRSNSTNQWFSFLTRSREIDRTSEAAPITAPPAALAI